MSLHTQFGRFMLACILSLAAFPVLYSGTMGANQTVITLGLILFGIAMILQLVSFFVKDK